MMDLNNNELELLKTAFKKQKGPDTLTYVVVVMTFIGLVLAALAIVISLKK